MSIESNGGIHTPTCDLCGEERKSVYGQLADDRIINKENYSTEHTYYSFENGYSVYVNAERHNSEKKEPEIKVMVLSDYSPARIIFERFHESTIPVILEMVKDWEMMERREGK